MIKINNITHSVLFNLIHDKNTTSNLFTGIIYITDFKGNFINAFKVNNGTFISYYKKYATNNKISTNSRITDGYETCPNHEGCIFATQELNEVIITGSSNSFNWLNWFFIGLDQMQDQFGGSSGGGESWDYYMPSATDGENINACGDGWVYDINTGLCVENKKNPCENVYNLMNETKTKAVYDILATKINESREYGYSKKLDGNWSEGILGNNGHSIEIGSSNVGFLHTHTYNTGSIHMFSDVDIIKFLFQVKYAINNGIDMSEVIGGMVSDSGTYVMSYDGSIHNDLAVLGGWTETKMRKEYRKAYRMSGGDLTKLFHDFIAKLGIKGITLTKRQNDGTFKESVLNNDGTTTEKEC